LDSQIAIDALEKMKDLKNENSTGIIILYKSLSKKKKKKKKKTKKKKKKKKKNRIDVILYFIFM